MAKHLRKVGSIIFIGDPFVVVVGFCQYGSVGTILWPLADIPAVVACGSLTDLTRCLVGTASSRVEVAVSDPKPPYLPKGLSSVADGE